MKKQIIIWQIIVVGLSIFMIFTVRTFLENKIIVEAMKVQSETMANRASCFALAEEKNLNDSYCKGIDTTAYRLFEKYKLEIIP